MLVGMTTFSHEPPGYSCPFCVMQHGEIDDLNQPTDVVAVTELAFARIAPRWWQHNPGEALVITRGHYENLYDTPPEVAHAVMDLTHRVAVAMRKAYPCEGITLRQNNEPASQQDVWHLHMHVIARHPRDVLYVHAKNGRGGRWVTAEERRPFAQLLADELHLPRSFD
jgi:histidine triad (HIT) family protein